MIYLWPFFNFGSVESEVRLTQDNNVEQVGHLKILKAIVVDKDAEETEEMGEDEGQEAQ